MEMAASVNTTTVSTWGEKSQVAAIKTSPLSLEESGDVCEYAGLS